MKYYCYILIDPRNTEPFYVGKGHGKRSDTHYNLSIKKTHYNPKLQNKILKIYKVTGDKPIVKKLDYQLEDEGVMLVLERMLIWYYRNEGYDLCNMTDGGDGLINPSKETRNKMSLSHIGKKHSEEQKQKIGISQLGKVNSRETIDKIRKGNIGKKRSDETKQKIRDVNIGKKHSEETKKKMSLSRMGNKNALKKGITQ